MILISWDVCFVYAKIFKLNTILGKCKLNLAWVQWNYHGTNDSRFQIDSSEAVSHAGLWFSVVEPEVCKLCRSRSGWNVVSYYLKGAKTFWDGFCVLRLQGSPLWPGVSYCRGSWSYSKNLSFTYILLLLLAVGYWRVPWTSTAFLGQFVQGRLWSDLDWSDVKPETLQTTLEPAQPAFRIVLYVE